MRIRSSERFVSASICCEVPRAALLLLRLTLHALDLRVGDLARVREDVRRLALRLADQLLVLLEQLAGLGARAVGLLDRFANAVPPLVDRLLDRAEGEPPEDENDRKADERPDQPRDDVDQAAGALLLGLLGE